MAKKVLVLGAGLVARPLVHHLLDNGFVPVIATRTVDKADALLRGRTGGQTAAVDLEDPRGLDALIEDADLTVSLVPYTYHVRIARRCLAVGRPMITTSYVSNEMRELSQEATARGLLILNEIGLDPGIDHMSAMRIIHAVQKAGGRVTAFRSNCGGLPAPDANDNPWGYKFSWSPRGVLLAGRNSARFLESGSVRDIPSSDLFATVRPAEVAGVGPLEVYPNRDSLQYVGIYGLAGVETLVRGTFRYRGWCRMMKTLVDIGWLSLDKPPRGAATLGNLTALLLRAGKDATSEDQLARVIAARFGLEPDGDTIRRLRWAGLLRDVPAEPAESILDVLGARLKNLLAYKPGERDMIVLVHTFQAVTAGGAKQSISSTLVDFGQPDGDSAMARTVSLPAAIAARLMLEGRIDATGVRIPVEPNIYAPVLEELERVGIRCVEQHD